MKDDKRSRRTRRLLKEALLHLITQKRYETISVAEIVAQADVSRSTFYAHFASKEDLLLSGFDQWLLSLGRNAGGDDRKFCFSLPFLQHMQGASHVFTASLKEAGGRRIWRRIGEMIRDTIGEELLRIDPVAGDDPLFEGRKMMLAGAFLDLARWWRGEAKGMGAEQIDALFQQLAIPAR